MFKKTLFAFTILLLVYSNVSSQTDTILHRYSQYLFNTQHPSNVKGLIHSLNNEGKWSDIDYEDKSRAFWKTLQHLQRLQDMAIAWANPRSEWYHQVTLWSKINIALNHWLQSHYHNPNWWYNEIGLPQYMRNIIILLRPHLSSEQLTNSLKELAQYRINGTGANLIWSADLGFHYGALTGDTLLMRHCIDTITQEIKITNEEGIQPDYSFKMHHARLQIYSYGAPFLSDNVRLAMECRGTTWAFPQEKIDMLSNFVLRGWQWMCRGINTVPGTIDRTVSRKDALHAADIRQLIPSLIKLCPDKETEWNAIAKWQNDKDHALLGFRYFPYTDFAAFQCKEFSFFLKTISTRTLPSESINSENLQGHLLNSGDAYLIQDGTEYFNLMPVWNWNKIPGITSFKGAQKIIREPFVGSVSDSESGFTAMDYEMQGKDTTQNIHAHKIWVYHDNLIVCLIAGLTATNVDGSISTILDQCRLNGDIMVNEASYKIEKGDHVLRNVKWIYHHGFAYLPLKTSTIDLYSGSVQGTWKSINASESDSLVVDSVFIPVLVHGKEPKNLSSGYVLTYLPSASRVEGLIDNPSWKILRNDSTCQAVQFKDGSLMVAFFSPSYLNATNDVHIKVNKPCLILLSKNKVYISDPTHQGQKIRIEINQHEMNVQPPEDGTTLARHLDY